MKVLTLTQPWATLMALGEKCWETRSWKTPHRGMLAIHAAKSFPKDCRELLKEHPYVRVLEKHGFWDATQFPLGQIIAVVELVGCESTLLVQQMVSHKASPAAHEIQFGDYSYGRWAWLTRNVQRIEPITAKGRLGLWEHPIP